MNGFFYTVTYSFDCDRHAVGPFPTWESAWAAMLKNAQNAAAWLDGILNMMDEMGDIAESLGLFEYPERDLYTDRCFDERYNDLLKRSPEKEKEDESR